MNPSTQSSELSFSGLGVHLSNLCRLSTAKSRSISPENFSGEKGGGARSTDGAAKGAAEKLGLGWKASPFITIRPGESAVLAEICGSGAVQHIWMTPTGPWRSSILRVYWDGEESPSIEAPVGDFFCSGWGPFAQLSSLPVTVNPGSAFNCYWEMPFRRAARITLENIASKEMRLFYQIDYALATVAADAAYFHAQFRRTNPVRKKEVYTMVDNVRGQGHYVGTYLAWGVNSPGWWGEGEVKFYIDGDTEFPTICGTGTEDYFGGSYNFENQTTKQYQEFTTPYAGLHQVIRPDGVYRSQQRFGMYRWHIPDPIRFEQDLRVTVQALGFGHDGRYRTRQDDVASVAFWYQAEPHQPFSPLPEAEALETS